MGSQQELVDVLILGGGISGLAAALTLARQQHTAIVFDSKDYRNAPSPKMHNVLTWDRQPPGEFRAAAKQNILDGYSTIRFEDVELVSVTKQGDGSSFTVASQDGRTWTGRKVILATGNTDILPDIPGYTDCWAKGIYHCFFCKGYEARGGSSAGILALPDLGTVAMALHFARIARRFTPTVHIYTHGSTELADAIRAEQGNSEERQVFAVDARRIERFEKLATGADVAIHFADGTSVVESFIGHKPPTRTKGPFAEQLSLTMLPSGDPQVAPMFLQTSVPGVFACGDNASSMKIAPQALLSGSAAGAACCIQLQAEDVQQKCIF